MRRLIHDSLPHVQVLGRSSSEEEGRQAQLHLESVDGEPGLMLRHPGHWGFIPAPEQSRGDSEYEPFQRGMPL